MSAPVICRLCKCKTVGLSNAVSTRCDCSPRDLVHHSTSFVPFVVACGYDGDENGARTSSAQLEAVDCTPCLRIAWAEKEGRELAEHVRSRGLFPGPDLDLLSASMDDVMRRAFKLAYAAAMGDGK